MASEQTNINKRPWLEDLEERCRKIAKIAEERESAQIIQLPLWQDGKRGSPNSVIRSALFAAIQSKDRSLVKDEIIFSQQGFSVKYSGEKLNQEDMTVWLTLVDLVRQNPLGTECNFTAYGILKHMGLNDGGNQRKRLYEHLKRLAGGLIEIKLNRGAYCGSFVDDFYVDGENDRYRLILNKKLINIFRDNDWTAINWDQRKRLRKKPLASKLHEYYSSHERPLPLTFDFIYRITGSTSKDKYGFKTKVKAALDELVKIDFLASYKIEDGKVVVERKNSRAFPSAKNRE
jgi:hypothetical protein